MKARYQALARRFDQKKPRERALWFLISIGAMLLVLDTLLLEDLREQNQQQEQAISQTQEQIAELVQQQAQLSAQVGDDPNEIARAEIAEQEQALKVLQAELGERFEAFISPEQMRQVLRALVQASRQIDLLTLESKTPRLISTQVSESEEDISVPQVFSRGVNVELTGSFHGLLAYLTMLEDLPWVVGWRVLEIDAEHYPENHFRLHLFTLSIDEEWLRV